MTDSTGNTAECLCGRSAARAHCPNCGSYQTYGYSSRARAIRRDGKPVELKAYRCLVCSERFNDDDWQLRCHAMPMRRLGRPRSLSVKVNSAEEKARLLAHLQQIQKLKDLS